MAFEVELGTHESERNCLIKFFFLFFDNYLPDNVKRF